MSKNDNIEVKLTIPDKEPYEGKATMKQKKRIWDLGYKDQKIINDLGKQQASSIITQILETYGDVMEKDSKKQSAKKMMMWAMVLLITSLAAKIADFPTFALILFLLGVIFLSVSGLRLMTCK
jgi:hypothetical protein